MNDRIHAWLDGELAFEALSSEERAEARRVEAALDRAVALTETRSPGLAAKVMDSLPAGAPRRRPSLVSRLRGMARRPALLRPAALAAFSLLVGFGLGLWSATGTGVGGADEATAVAAEPGVDSPATVYVRFDVMVPDAEAVELAGSFSDWEPRYALTPYGEGHWTVTVPLAPGVHDYLFVVDGSRQVLDPAAPQIADGFGSYNNRIALLASSI